jgi:MarR family 2-MHQ and catechol resistance regulon transcriptional repressor
MTAAVDRLENRQFIVRKATREDRRARQLQLTEEGRKFITTVFEAHNKELENWLSVLTAEEKQQAYALLKKLGLSAAAVHQARTNTSQEKRQP